MAKRRRKGYWEYCAAKCPSDEDGRILEPRRANPTQFPESEPDERSDELKAAIEFIGDGGLDKLPVRQRRAFKLVVIAGLSLRQAGARMGGISATAVRKRVRSAGRAIKKLLEDRV